MIAVAFALLLIFICVGLPVAAALGLMGYVLQAKYAFFPMTGALGELAWNSSSDFILIALPMFVMMGELMHRSGMSERLFAALTPWFA
ncbi:MAG: TRAP transporter large permease subunit, partial [Tagaea sp.]